MCNCGKPLNVSFYSADGKLKCCTGCSQKAGVHVLHPVDEFGKDKREHDSNLSQCLACRSQMWTLRQQGVNAKTHTLAQRLVMIDTYETMWTVECTDGIELIAPRVRDPHATNI